MLLSNGSGAPAMDRKINPAQWRIVVVFRGNFNFGSGCASEIPRQAEFDQARMAGVTRTEWDDGVAGAALARSASVSAR